MANQPSKDKQAVTFRLPKTLVATAKEAAARRQETVTDLVIRGLTREIQEAPPTGSSTET